MASEDPPSAPAWSEPLRLTDAATLKALAHPARQLMLARMQLEGPVTATEVSELVGLSPSACSWHLRALAKAGLAARAEGSDGRETRWRAVARGTSYGPEQSEDPAYAAAARVLSDQHTQLRNAVRRAWEAREDRDDPQWRRAAARTDDIVWMTPEELDALNGRWLAELRSYQRLSPQERPAGSRQVFVAFDGSPFELEWLAEEMRRPPSGGRL